MSLSTEWKSKTKKQQTACKFNKTNAPPQAPLTLSKNRKFNLLCYILLSVLILIVLSHCCSPHFCSEYIFITTIS